MDSLTTASADNSILPPQKRLRGRPKGSKNMPKTPPPPLLETRLRPLDSINKFNPKIESSLFETKTLNSMAAVEIPVSEAMGNNHVHVQVKRPVGRPKGSNNRPKEVPTGNNHVLKKPVGRPKGSKNKPKIVPPPPPPPPLFDINALTIIQIPAGYDVVRWLLDFCRFFQVSLKVLDGSGQLSNIIPYDQPSSVLIGPFEMQSLSGIVMWTPPPSVSYLEDTVFPLEVSLSSLGDTLSIGRSATAVSMVKVVATTMTANGDLVEDAMQLDYDMQENYDEDEFTAYEEETYENEFLVCA